MNKRGRKKENTSGRRLSQKHLGKSKFFHKGIAYFLVFLLLLGNLQALSYAEGNVQELAKQIGNKVEETIKESLQDLKEEQAGNAAEKEEGSSVEKNEESQVAEAKDATSEEKEKSKDNSDKKKAEDASDSEEVKEGEEVAESEEVKEKPEYMEAGSFESLSGKNLLISASYGEETFFEGTFMKIVPVEEEAVLEEAKAHLEKEYRS